MWKKLIKAWCFFWIAMGPFGGIAIGFFIANWYESQKHNVSFYDAVFIESWHKTEAE